MHKFLLYILSFFVFISCSSLDTWKQSSLGKLRKSQVKTAKFTYFMENKEVQIHKYSSISKRKTFAAGQIRNEKEEGVDFSVQYYSEQKDPQLKMYPVYVSTIEKEGFVNLRDLSFPELGERMLYVYNDKAKVMAADSYTEDSVYFIPNFIMPEQDEVEVGDTWTYERPWVTEENSLPLTLKLVSILKSYIDCGNRLCADVEISGTVQLDPSIGVEFGSDLSGRMFVEVNTGTILWQQIRTQEIVEEGATRVLNNSCISSYLASPMTRGIEVPKAFQSCTIQEDSMYVEPLSY